MLAYILTNSNSLTLVLNGKTHNLAPDHTEYSKVISALKSWQAADEDRRLEIEEELKDLFAKGQTPLGGHCEIVDGEVFYKGRALHNSITSRILEIDSLGLPPEPMLRFLENVMQNPSATSQKELYDFLQHKNLPITEDGCFLAYKAVRSDCMDKYSGTIDNSVGQVVEFDRSRVDDDRRHQCSFGLHVGAVEYVRWYGGDSDDRFMIVKINPRDAVSVPLDHHAQKLRVCRYEVLMEVERDTILDFPVYSSTGEKCNIDDCQFNCWDDEQDWEDESEDDGYWDDEEWDSFEDEEETRRIEADLVRTQAEKYDESYDRDNVCRLASERGVVPSAEAARRLGKASVCALLAEDDLKSGRI